MFPFDFLFDFFGVCKIMIGSLPAIIVKNCIFWTFPFDFLFDVLFDFFGVCKIMIGSLPAIIFCFSKCMMMGSLPASFGSNYRRKANQSVEKAKKTLEKRFRALEKAHGRTRRRAMLWKRQQERWSQTLFQTICGH